VLRLGAAGERSADAPARRPDHLSMLAIIRRPARRHYLGRIVASPTATRSPTLSTTTKRGDCIKTDSYGRSVCKVMVTPVPAAIGPQTFDVGLAMITTGMAWWCRAYAREFCGQG